MSDEQQDTSAEGSRFSRAPVPHDPPTPADLARMVEYIGERQTALEDRIGPLIEHSVKVSVQAAMPTTTLTEEEHQWIKGALRAQAERAELRKAVIQKTLTGLIWLALGGIGTAVWQAVKANLRQ